MNVFESGIILWIQENIRGPVGNVFWQFITHLGDEGYLWIAMGVVLLFFKKTRPIGFTVLVSLLFDFLTINVVLKGLVARPRPFVVNGWWGVTVSFLPIWTFRRFLCSYVCLVSLGTEEDRCSGTVFSNTGRAVQIVCGCTLPDRHHWWLRHWIYLQCIGIRYCKNGNE